MPEQWKWIFLTGTQMPVKLSARLSVCETWHCFLAFAALYWFPNLAVKAAANYRNQWLDLEQVHSGFIQEDCRLQRGILCFCGALQQGLSERGYSCLRVQLTKINKLSFRLARTEKYDSCAAGLE